ncbi:hypothetical protein D3C76_1756450 [compost metagenome]
MDIPLSLQEYGIDENLFKEKAALMAERAVADACTGSNPRTIDKEQMQKVYECADYGTKVDF